MHPLTDRVLIEVDPATERSESGLYIHEDWKTLPPFGTVIAIGPDVTTIEKGDRVVFERYASAVAGDNKNWRLCKESQLLAKLKEPTDDNES